MSYSRNSGYKYVSNSRVSSRYKQFLVLIGAIIIGMIISSVVNAIPSSTAVPKAGITTHISESR